MSIAQAQRGGNRINVSLHASHSNYMLQNSFLNSVSILPIIKDFKKFQGGIPESNIHKYMPLN